MTSQQVVSAARQGDRSAGGGQRSRPTAQTLQRPVYCSHHSPAKGSDQERSADASSNADVLMQVVQSEQVDGMTVELTVELTLSPGTLKSPTTTNLQSRLNRQQFLKHV